MFLATPFLHMSTNELEFGILRRLLPLILGGVPLLVLLGPFVALFPTFFIDKGNPNFILHGWLALFVVFSSFGVSGLLAFKLARRFSRIDVLLKRMPEVCKSYEPPTPDRQRVLILRKVGDEAAAALGAGRPVEWLLGWSWRALSYPLSLFEMACNWIKRQKTQRWYTFVVSAGLVAVLILCVVFIREFFTFDVKGIAIDKSLSDFSIQYLVPIFGGVLWFVVLSYLVLLLMVLSLNVLRFGIVKDFGTTYLMRVSAEPTPPGSWEIELLPAKFFAHSEIHEDLTVADRVANWVLAKDAAFYNREDT